MRKKRIDLQAVRRADARLRQLLEDHPELREPNPERQAALGDWLATHTAQKEPRTVEDYRVLLHASVDRLAALGNPALLWAVNVVMREMMGEVDDVEETR